MVKIKRNPLLTLRDDLQITQRKIGDQLGLTGAAIGAVERGETGFSRHQVSQIWKLYREDFMRLGFTVFDLLE